MANLSNAHERDTDGDEDSTHRWYSVQALLTPVTTPGPAQLETVVPHADTHSWNGTSAQMTLKDEQAGLQEHTHQEEIQQQECNTQLEEHQQEQQEGQPLEQHVFQGCNAQPEEHHQQEQQDGQPLEGPGQEQHPDHPGQGEEQEETAYQDTSRYRAADISPPSTAKFSLDDILSNTSLARVAMMEAAGGATPGEHGTMHDHTQGLRQAAELLDDDVQEEEMMTTELSNTIVRLLEESRTDVEMIGLVVGALQAGESAYTGVMTSCLRNRRLAQHPSSEHMSGMVVLPKALLSAHLELMESLKTLIEPLKQLLNEFDRACREVTGEAAATRSKVTQARLAVSQAVASHAASAATMSAAMEAHMAGRRAQGPSVDPWAKERQLLQELRTLQRWQDKERSFLQTAFAQAKALETKRGAAFSQVAATVANGYSVGAHAMLAAVRRATGLCANGHGDFDVGNMHDQKLQELTRAAATIRDASAGLASKQAENVEAVNLQLFCSPEIVRQGEVELLNGCTRQALHAVLTRAGVLYLFKRAAKDGGGVGDLLDTIKLSSYQFEEAHAPCFNLVHQESGWLWNNAPRKHAFQAPSVEDSCEWAIGIREAIAIWTAP